MGKLEYLNIVLINSQRDAYYPGSTISGQIQFNYNQEEKLRGIRCELVGVTETSWTETEKDHEDNDVTIYYGYTQYHVKTELILWGLSSSAGSSSVQPVPIGPTSIPFIFQLPQILPESYEGGSNGFTRYYIKATMDRPWKFDHTTTKYFSVLGSLDLNSIATLGYSQVPLMNELQKQGSKRMTCCCCCFPLFCFGRFHYDFHVAKTGYVPGESIRVWGSVRNNTKGAIEGLKLKLIQVTTFYGCRDGHRFHSDEPFARIYANNVVRSETAVELPLSVYPARVEPNQTVILGGAANDTTCIMTIPPLPCTRLNGGPIDIQYYLELKMEGDNCCLSAQPRIGTIVIGAVPLYSAPILPPIMSMPFNPNFNYELPPPMYADSVFGAQSLQFNIAEKREGEVETPVRIKGPQVTEFAPVYAFYQWDQQPPPPPPQQNLPEGSGVPLNM